MHALHMRALSSIGRPWQSQPGTYLTRRPCSIWYFMMMSFSTCDQQEPDWDSVESLELDWICASCSHFCSLCSLCSLCTKAPGIATITTMATAQVCVAVGAKGPEAPIDKTMLGTGPRSASTRRTSDLCSARAC